MTRTIITFEIHDTTAHETLYENVHHNDIPDLLMACQLFYPQHNIVVCCREVTFTERVRYIPKDEFKHDWYDMLDEIIDNLYA